MKYLLRLLLVLLVVTLSGCKATSALEQLDTPENLLFEDILKWNEVENATEYLVYIDEELFITSDNYFIISEQGEYSVYVIASAQGYKNSDASTILELSLSYQNTINPTIINDGVQFSWEVIDDAIRYNVYINGTKSEMQPNLPEFSIPEASGVYEISIQAVYPVGESNVTNPIRFAIALIDGPPVYYQYSINSTQNILLLDAVFAKDLYAMDMDGNFIDNALIFDMSGDYKTIKSSFITEQPLGDFVFHIIADNYKIPVTIDVTDRDKPYIISSSITHTQGNNDVLLQFELFDGEFYSINGTAEDNVLYNIEGNILTIEKEFITDKFNSVDEFALSYAINIDEDSVVGYLFFDHVMYD